jgi:hypothetical protein
MVAATTAIALELVSEALHGDLGHLVPVVYDTSTQH